MTKVNSAIGIEYNSHEIKAVELLKKTDGTLETTAFAREEIPENVIMIGKYAFSSCKNLRTITIHENLIYFGKSAFYRTFRNIQHLSNAIKFVILS